MQAADRIIQWRIPPRNFECERGTGMQESMQRIWLGHQYRYLFLLDFSLMLVLYTYNIWRKQSSQDLRNGSYRYHFTNSDTIPRIAVL